MALLFRTFTVFTAMSRVSAISFVFLPVRESSTIRLLAGGELQWQFEVAGWLLVR